MASIEPEIEFGIDEIKLREQVQAKLTAEAAAWKGGSLSGDGALKASMIGGVDTSSLDDGPSGAFGDSGVILDTGTLSDDTPPDDDGPSGGPTGGLGGPFGPGVLGTNQLELEGDGTNTGYTTTKGAFDNGGTDFSSPDTSNPAFEADD